MIAVCKTRSMSGSASSPPGKRGREELTKRRSTHRRPWAPLRSAEAAADGRAPRERGAVWGRGCRDRMGVPQGKADLTAPSFPGFLEGRVTCSPVRDSSSFVTRGIRHDNCLAPFWAVLDHVLSPVPSTALALMNGCGRACRRW